MVLYRSNGWVVGDGDGVVERISINVLSVIHQRKCLNYSNGNVEMSSALRSPFSIPQSRISDPLGHSCFVSVGWTWTELMKRQQTDKPLDVMRTDEWVVQGGWWVVGQPPTMAFSPSLISHQKVPEMVSLFGPVCRSLYIHAGWILCLVRDFYKHTVPKKIFPILKGLNGLWRYTYAIVYI